MALCERNSGPFRNDQPTRLFEVSPSFVFDERLARASLDYMVSALAVQLNQHLWNHISVELRRKLGHEFINGFNYEVMATFGCSHDIQVLLEGSDVADRIHYCCKPSCIVPQRVAALAYIMTNRQAIAGPLAALYLYRGSCCYSSAVCASLPLGISQFENEDASMNTFEPGKLHAAIWHCDEVEDGCTDGQFTSIWEEDASDIILESLSLNPAVCSTSASPTVKPQIWVSDAGTDNPIIFQVAPTVLMSDTEVVELLMGLSLMPVRSGNLQLA
ncbi:hypothetical protein GQ600_26342 [Phytophthora cactorum]|nr:hypothetical protein GQ600_26342 [Phytophthora cactorum]